MKRVIFVEPEIENCTEVINFFNRHNPDSSFVNPHICLVFPFESEMDKEFINKILLETLHKYEEFIITLSGISISYEEKNNFVFLNVNDGNGYLEKISKELYALLGDNALLKGVYIPHITIAKNSDIEIIRKIEEEAQMFNNVEYRAKVSKINSKIININDEGKTELVDEISYELYNRGNNL